MADKTFPRGELLDRLRLIRTDTVGPVAFEQLVGLYGSAGTALDALPGLARKGGARAASSESRLRI